MYKFSIIIPVYNVEKYLEKCLESIVNQTYTNYEVIVVCDKCTDNSEKIVDKYVEKYKFKKIYCENTGLSKARNLGIEIAKGDYLLFLDGDDYFENDLLKVLNDNLFNKDDIIRFQAREVFEHKTIDYNESSFAYKRGLDAFKIIDKFHYVENAWLYCYNLEFWKKNNFKYAEGKAAEDYGLTPLVISKANSVRCLSYIGYNYVQRENSLMNNNEYNKKIKKINDMIKQAEEEKKHLINIEGAQEIISFLNNSMIYYITTLNFKDYIKYKKILKSNRCFDYLRKDGIKNKIKTFLIKHFTKLAYCYRRSHA